MLRLRIIVPSEVHEHALALFDREPGITHVVLYRDAGVDPAGDVICGDISRKRVDSVLGRLRALGLDQRGAITMETIDTVVSKSAHRAEKNAPGDPADVLVWEELVGRTHEESTLNLTFLGFLCLACLMTAIGVINDSPVTVVGAMVVGPEFGPLAALSVALVRRRMDLARRALIALVAGFSVAMTVTAIVTVVGGAAGWLNLDHLHDPQDVDFVFQVGAVSMMVALLAGAAGMLSLTSAKLAALTGVFISVTTVPAAGFAVVAAASGAWDVVAKSITQLGVNLVGITAAGVVVLAVRQRRALRRNVDTPQRQFALHAPEPM